MSASKKQVQQSRLAGTIDFIKTETAKLPIVEDNFKPSFQDQNNWILLRLAPITEPRRAYMLEAHKNRQGNDESKLKRLGHSLKEGLHTVFVEGSHRTALRKELARNENSDLCKWVLHMNEVFHSEKAGDGGYTPFDGVERVLTLIELAHSQITPLFEQDPAISKDVIQQHIEEVTKSYHDAVLEPHPSSP